LAVDFIQKSAGNSSSTTLSSGVTNTETSFPLTSDTNFLAGGGIVIVDEGEAAEELAYYTGKSGGALTVPLVNRGLEGGSAQAHSAGATVKGVLSADTWNNAMEALLNLVVITSGAVDTTKVVTPTVLTDGTRINPRTTTEVSSATPTINTDNTDTHTITALAEAITSFTTNLSGTPVNGQKLIIRIKDDGTARAIAWGASFADRGATLPTTTVLGKYHYIGLIYNSTASVWDCVAAIVES
jgi:hypothetical protein